MIPEQEAYLAFTRRIVADELPDEKGAFDLASTSIAAELYSSGGLASDRRTDNDFQFMETATSILNFVTLMVGTFEALRRLYKSWKKKKVKSESEVADAWRSELRAAGLAEEMTNRIVMKFEKDLADLLSRSEPATNE